MSIIAIANIRFCVFYGYLFTINDMTNYYCMLKFFPLAKPSDHGKIVDITLSPNPPKIGSDLFINATVSIGKLGAYSYSYSHVL